MLDVLAGADRLTQQAARIHEALAASTEPIAAAVSRRYARQAAATLRRGFFRKPMLMGSAAWVGKMVVYDVNAFIFLAGHIELQMAYKARLYCWTGYGTKFIPNDGMTSVIRDFVLSKTGPFYVRFQLGTKSEPFQNLLEGLNDPSEAV